MTASFAPPCRRPLRDPTAAVTAEYRSDSDDVTTRAVKVDALKQCSAYSTSETSNARTTTGSGSSPKVIHRTFSANPRSSRAGIGSSPRRRRWSSATTPGSWAIRRSDLVKLACFDASWVVGSCAPMTLTAVRTTSIGWQVVGSVRTASITGCGSVR